MTSALNAVPSRTVDDGMRPQHKIDIIVADVLPVGSVCGDDVDLESLRNGEYPYSEPARPAFGTHHSAPRSGRSDWITLLK